MVSTFDRGFYGPAGSHCGSSASDGAKVERWSPAHHHRCDDKPFTPQRQTDHDHGRPRLPRETSLTTAPRLHCSCCPARRCFEKAEGEWLACHSSPFGTTTPTFFPGPALQSRLPCVMLREINRSSIQEALHRRIRQPRPLLRAWYSCRCSLSRPQVSGTRHTACFFSPGAARASDSRHSCAGLPAYFWDGTGRPLASAKQQQGVRCALPRGSRLACLTMPRPEIEGFPPVHVHFHFERRLSYGEHDHRRGGVSSLVKPP